MQQTTKRLQGANWHRNKKYLQLTELSCSYNDNLCGKYVDEAGRCYIHWLNDAEKQAVRAASVGKLFFEGGNKIGKNTKK